MRITRTAWLNSIALALGLNLGLLAPAHAAATLGQNLIVNGDAEAGTAGWTGFDGYDTFQSVDYGNNWVKPTQPGPADRGLKMFAGVGAQSAGFQTLALGDLGTQPLQYELSGWLGGWLEQQDNALLYVSFLDITGHEIGFAAIGPVMPGDRDNQTGLFYRESAGLLPAGVSQVMFSLSVERLSGGDSDGYADNLSFVLTAAPVPEAGSMAYVLAGLGVAATLVRRRQPA
jgi:hypothetical protein